MRKSDETYVCARVHRKILLKCLFIFCVFVREYTCQHTVSFTDLDHCSKIIIFESILTTFEAGFIFLMQLGQKQKLART